MTEDFVTIGLKAVLKETFARIEVAIEKPTELGCETIAIELDSLSRVFSYTAGYLAATKEAKQIIDEKGENYGED